MMHVIGWNKSENKNNHTRSFVLTWPVGAEVVVIHIVIPVTSSRVKDEAGPNKNLEPHQPGKGGREGGREKGRKGGRERAIQGKNTV